MYDICVIGGGIVGKYLASKLSGRNIAWVSSQHPEYFSTQPYKLSQHIGKTDTWQEKATGLISWPNAQDIEQFPIPDNQWRKYKGELGEELGIRSLQEVGEAPLYQSTMQCLQKGFARESLRYFESAHQVFTGPTFDYREEYDQFWSKQIPKWRFLSLKPDYFHAECFELDKGKAISIYGTDMQGNYTNIQAKQFIVAAHVPGTVQLLKNTYSQYRIRGKTALGRGFSDHPQLSFGFLCVDQKISRATLPSIGYQDYQWQDLRFRLEFHTAPPRKELVDACLKRFPQYTRAHFVKHFVRVVAIPHMPSLYGHKINFLGAGRYTVSRSFYQWISHYMTVLLSFLKEEVFVLNDWKLLNHHFPWHFAGHLSGGATFPNVVDEAFFLRNIPNVAIASSAVFPTNGLFNPTMTTLSSAKHIISHHI